MSKFKECYEFVNVYQDKINAVKLFINKLENENEHYSSIDNLEKIDCHWTMDINPVICMTVDSFNIHQMLKEDDSFSFEMVYEGIGYNANYSYRYWITHKPTRIMFILNVTQKVKNSS